MKLVLIESPYWSEDPEIRARNRRYARACMKDSFNRGEAPFASHMLYPQVYPDDNETRAPGAREKGILAGLEWGRRATCGRPSVGATARSGDLQRTAWPLSALGFPLFIRPLPHWLAAGSGR
jgi:hypothetical protein